MEAKKRINFIATVKVPTKVRVSYEIADEADIEPILEQLLEQHRRTRGEPSQTLNGSKKSTPRILSKKLKKGTGKKAN
jgi:hypothetical protein